MPDVNEKPANLAKVVSLYSQGKEIPEIAAALAIEPAEVNRLLAEARRDGIVQITVRHALQTDPELEAQLAAAFHLKEVRVLVRDQKPYAEMTTLLGQLAAAYFADVVHENSVIGISLGSAFYPMIQALRPLHLPEAEVVQLIGASGAENVPTDGPVLAQLLAERLGSKCYYLHAPLLVDSEEARDALIRDHAIKETLARAEHADIALVGIGSTDPELYSLLRAGYVSSDELDYIRSRGAVGDICAQHYDANGQWLNIGINRRVIGITLGMLKHIPTVVGVAGDARKAETILAALRGGHINVLITDDTAARAVLDRYAALQKAAPAVAEESAVTPVAELHKIWKIFAGVPVLWGVDLDLKPGEVHALLGGNGSGKSTLMKILSGVYTPDAGTIKLDGKVVHIEGPAHAHELGVYLVPQEPNIFPHLSVEENILIGTKIDPAAARERIKQLAADLGFEGRLSESAGRLSIANQQLLEIIRGLLRNAKVLIFDEPTSTLTFREVDSLFDNIRKLTAQGIGVFFISHRLNEIMVIADRVSVLRDGKFVLRAPISAVTVRDLIQAMLPEGAEKVQIVQDTAYKPAQLGPVVLEVNNLRSEAFHNISFQVRGGEVVGLAGLVGAGRTEVAEAIWGIDKHAHGDVYIGGQRIAHRNPHKCQEAGLVYVPEDRHAHGIFLDLPNVQTTTAGILPHLGRWFLSFRREREIGQEYMHPLEIKHAGLNQLAQTLSGGNQQKVVLSKALAGHPRAIILDEPTRGVDAKARQDIYKLIHRLVQQGVGILLISSDLEEVAELSDRVLVMYRGSIVEELDHSECQVERITEAAFGLRGAL